MDSDSINYEDDHENYDDVDISASTPFQIENITKNTSRYVMACAVFASLNSVLLGYDIGVMSGAIIFIKQDLRISDVQEEVFVGILSIVSIFGSLIGGKTSDSIGRKPTMALAAVVFQSGACVMTLSSSYTALMTGRFLAGIGIGFGTMITPVYISEIAPTSSRGSFTSLPEIFINLGILLGYVSNYAFSSLPSRMGWRVMLGVGVAPSIFIGCALFGIPESPRWLVMRGRVDEARAVLLKTSEDVDEVEKRLREIEKTASSAKDEQRGAWVELLNPNPVVRRMLITGCGIQIFQQLTGIDATVYYSPTIFERAGLEGNGRILATTVAVGFTKTVFILVAIALIDRSGRKPLLYVSTVGMTCCLFVLGLTLSLSGGDGGNNNGNKFEIILVVVCVCGNVAFFSVGIGPICWVVSSEVFPLRLRARASALGSIGSRVSSGLVAMSFLSVTNAIGVGGAFLVFAFVSALSVVFVCKCVPETKGKSLEQIEAMFRDDKHWLGGGQVEISGDMKRLIR